HPAATRRRTSAPAPGSSTTPIYSTTRSGRWCGRRSASARLRCGSPITRTSPTWGVSSPRTRRRPPGGACFASRWRRSKVRAGIADLEGIARRRRAALTVVAARRPREHTTHMRPWAVLLLVAAPRALGQQMADPDFDTKVDRPAYPKEHPVVAIDEAHANFHTAEGRYKPFADLLAADGYRVVRGQKPFARA